MYVESKSLEKNLAYLLVRGFLDPFAVTPSQNSHIVKSTNLTAIIALFVFKHFNLIWSGLLYLQHL